MSKMKRLNLSNLSDNTKEATGSKKETDYALINRNSGTGAKQNH